MTIRVRLTALYAGVFLAATGLLLLVSYELMAGHLRSTLSRPVADDLLGRLAAQYLLAFVGVALIAIAAGWAAAGRALAPLAAITATARRVGEERLGERIGLEGPDDEVRELAETVDAMLDRLQAAVDAQRRFVANASHELRSPLTVIRTEAEVTLADPDATSAELRQMGRVVLEASERTDALLDALMVLARSQPELLRRVDVDLAVAARRAAATSAEEAGTRRIGVEVELAPAAVLGDAALLERLAANLVENAVRHNEPGGWVRVETFTREGTACLCVENGGAVVPVEDVERLTEPFERLDRASGRPGSGLGLSIARAVCEAHGGRLDVEARADGGLLVEARLPER